MSEKKSYKELGNLPAFSFDISHAVNFEHSYGISQRLYLMTHVEDHFESLDYETQKAIAGEPPKVNMYYGGSQTPTNARVQLESVEYAKWLAKGKILYRRMIVEEILNSEYE